MTLWIQPLFGDAIEIPFSPPILHWKRVYQYLQCRYFPDQRIHQLRLFRGESADLSGVEEGEMLHLFVTDLMVERWVSEYSITMEDTPAYTYHNSIVTWTDARWGDPYQNPSIQYRTPLMLHIVAREKEDRMDFMVMDSSVLNLYGRHIKKSDLPEHKWCSTLRWACDAFREGLNQTEEVCTESTTENIMHLWELYHGTNQHLVDQGRYYDY